MSTRYFVRRLMQLIPVLFGITILVFLLLHLVPGDPARALLGPRVPQEVVDALREEWGLDDPLPEQFALYIGRLLKGDLGESLAYSVPAAELIVGRIFPTVLLLLFATGLTLIITVPLATLAAANDGRWPDHIIRSIPLLGLGMPSFWVGILLILLAIRTGWFPAGGYGTTLPEQLRAVFLPGLTIALAVAPFTIRSLRTALLEVLDAEYVTTARAKGLSEWRVLWRHALRNAILPMVTVLGLSIGWLVGNTLVIEKVFALPGLGSLMIDAILERDFPVVQALALIFAVVVVLVNLATDVIRASLDPRTRLT